MFSTLTESITAMRGRTQQQQHQQHWSIKSTPESIKPTPVETQQDHDSVSTSAAFILATSVEQAGCKGKLPNLPMTGPPLKESRFPNDVQRKYKGCQTKKCRIVPEVCKHGTQFDGVRLKLPRLKATIPTETRGLRDPS